jgi:outer membrane protein OmpA-like peptidoglycan-associated protein
MKVNLKSVRIFTVMGLFLAGLVSTPLVAAGSESSEKPIKKQGVIIELFSTSFTLRDYWGREMMVDLTETTEIEEQKRNFLRDPKPYSPRELIPGLDVIVKGINTGGHIVAEEVKFTQDALKVARTIYSRVQPIEKELSDSNARLETVQTRVGNNEKKGQMLSGEVEELQAGVKLNRQQARTAGSTARQALAGVASNQMKLSSLNDRFSMLDEYDRYKTLTVHFPFDSTVISQEMESQLDQFFSEIAGLTGYLVEIRGFASTDGDDAYNRQLSQRRADGVRRYVTESHQIHLRRFVVPWGYGTLYPMADDSTLEGRKKNRRVEVRILVTPGMEGTDTSGTLAKTQDPSR